MSNSYSSGCNVVFTAAKLQIVLVLFPQQFSHHILVEGCHMCTVHIHSNNMHRFNMICTWF